MLLFDIARDFVFLRWASFLINLEILFALGWLFYNLSKITSCIDQINLSPSQINGRAFFVKTLIPSVSFPPQDIFLGSKV